MDFASIIEKNGNITRYGKWDWSLEDYWYIIWKHNM